MTKGHSEEGTIGFGAIASVSIGVVMLLSVVGFYSYASSVRNQALRWETDLNRVVRFEMSERATYENTFYEQTGLASMKSEKMDAIISNALEGRYGDNPNQGQALLQAIAEAYPSTEGLSIYDKILPTVSAGREAIRNKQNLRIEMAQSYNYWRKEGILRAWILSGIYPSRDLEFSVGGVKYYAAEALEKMAEPVSTVAVNESFREGVEKPLEVR